MGIKIHSSMGFFSLGLALVLNTGQASGVPAASTPLRVISMAPNLTEIVYDMGAQNLLVGVSDFCKYPPEARSKEKVGGWINPNYEKILSLKPDLVLALKFHGKAVDNLRGLKVKVLVLDCQTIRDIFEAYDALGKALGREADARKAKGKFKKRLENIRNRAKAAEPVSALFVVDRNPGSLEQIYGAGPGNFVDEMIRWSGGMNILSDAKEPYPLVSKELLFKRDPDVIIESLPESESSKTKYEKEAWKKYSNLKAVRNNRIYILNEDQLLVPGPTMAGLAETLFNIFQKTSANP